jgi:hypothetical protein
MEAATPLDPDFMYLLVVLHIVFSDLKLERYKTTIDTSYNIRLALSAPSVTVKVEAINAPTFKVTKCFILKI